MKLEDFLNRHPRLTRSLRKFVADYEDQLDEEDFGAFLTYLSTELSERAAEFAKLNSSEDRARLLHRLVDDEILQGAHVSYSCQAGCSACCYMEVEITSYEADILRDIILAGHGVDLGRLQAQSQRHLQDPLWKQGPRNLESQCVFLDAPGSCSIYEHRPVMCRRHSVSTPAKNCSTLDAPITIRYFPKVDVLISASNEDPQITRGPLAKMLMRSLKSFA